MTSIGIFGGAALGAVIGHVIGGEISRTMNNTNVNYVSIGGSSGGTIFAFFGLVISILVLYLVYMYKKKTKRT